MQTVRTIECCGLKFRICSDGIWVDMRNGEKRQLFNGREAVIVFLNEIESLVSDKLFPIIEEYGYDRYTGEKKKEPRNESS